MSRENDLKRLKKSLYETQDVLNGLINDTSTELAKKWDVTKADASKRLMEAGKRFEQNYDKARAQLDSNIKGTSKDLEKRYALSRKDAEKTIKKSRKDAEKVYSKTRHDAEKGFKDVRSEATKRFEEARAAATARKGDLKLRTATLLQGLAGGALALRNRLEPKTRFAIRNEKEKHHLGKGGYFKRFIALALIIVAKKNRMLSLGQQLYHKLQDQDARDAIKGEAIDQYDTLRRLIKAYANGEYREFPYLSIVKIVAAVVYFVSVVDLIPDFIPIIGLTDDLAILAWVYTSVKDDLQNFVDWEEANERRRQRMEGQSSDNASDNNTGNTGKSDNSGTTSGAARTTTPATDRGASPNAGTGTRSTTPTPSPSTTTIGASSSAINSKAFEGGSNMGTSSNAGTTTNPGGSSSKEDKSSASGNTGSGPANSGNSNAGGGNSGGSSKKSDDSSSSGGNSKK